MRRVAFVEVVGHLVSAIDQLDVFLFGIVDVQDGETGDQVLHVVDQVQHFVVERGVVEGNEGEIEYLIAFHNNITSISLQMLISQRIIKKHNTTHQQTLSLWQSLSIKRVFDCLDRYP